MENSFKHITNVNKFDTNVNRGEELQENSNSTLIFPRDMQKEFYPEAIKFSVYERHGVEYEEVKELVKSAFKTGGEFLEAHGRLIKARDNRATATEAKLREKIGQGPLPRNKFQELDDAVKQEERINQNLKGNLIGGIGKSDDFIGPTRGQVTQIVDKFKKANDQQKLKNTLERHLQSIYLAMPQSVNFAEGIDWQGSDLGVIGGLKSGALGFDEKTIDYGILTGAGAALGGAAGLGASMIPGISGIAGTVVGAVLGSSGLQSGIESTFGVKTNPFKEQTFQGVGFRPFDFSFNFRARSQTDVLVIRNIINAFRSYSKPTFKEGSNGAIFKYPKEFRIEFLTLDDNNSYVTNEYLPEIKFCICTAINTNFTAQGWKSFDGGAPTDITLQMTFQETEIVTGEDVSGNTKNGRFAGYKGSGKGRF